MPLPSDKTALLALLVGVGALVSCTKGLEGPKASPEVYILDGLVFEYGAETPCYKGGVAEHATRCAVWGKELKQAHPVVQVQLQPFAIDQREVSNREYRHCVETAGCEDLWFTDSFDQGIDYYLNGRYDNYPVHQVSWKMAQAYCESQGRRLPTDAEWQRVAQGSRVLGTHRTFPAEGIKTLEDCLGSPNGVINGVVCNGVKEFTRVGDHGGDYVDEGYDADLNPARIFHLFSNVSEFTGGNYQDDVTCKEALPRPPRDPEEGEEQFICIPPRDDCDVYEGGDYPDIPNCIDCDDCEEFLDGNGQKTVQADKCYQECRICEACEGTLQDSTPYYTEGYPLEPVDCFIDCWSASRENPSCVRWDPADQPLDASAVAGSGLEKSVRGGHVGIPNDSTDECRYRSDYRDKRYQADGSPDTSNLATAKGVGFRCARSLTQDELDELGAEEDARFVHLFGGPPEVIEAVHPDFCAEICDATCTPEACQCSVVAGWSGSACSDFNCIVDAHCAAAGDTEATCKQPSNPAFGKPTCECTEDAGWGGLDCSFTCTSAAHCTDGGDGSATCTSGGACECGSGSGWSGTTCSDFTCTKSEHCTAGGDSGATCADDDCACSPDSGYSGKDCATFHCEDDEHCGDGETCDTDSGQCE